MKRTVTDELLQTVAALRAAGRTWDAIAAEVKRPANRLRHWPAEHRQRWQHYFLMAERDQAREATAESRTALRKLLREKDNKTIADAAATLLRHQPKRAPRSKAKRPTVSVAAVKLAEYVEGLSDADLETHLLELDAASPDTPPPGETATAVDAAPAPLPA